MKNLLSIFLSIFIQFPIFGQNSFLVALCQCTNYQKSNFYKESQFLEEGWDESATKIQMSSFVNLYPNLLIEGMFSDLVIFPNPTNGEQFTLSLNKVEEGVETATVDIFNINGSRVITQVVPVNGDRIYQKVNLIGLSSGVYIVHINAGGSLYVEYLWVSK